MRRFARLTLYLSLLLGALINAVCANDTDVPGQVGIRLQHLGVEQGLSQVTARALAQDSEGLLWIGTQDGLDRYDGEDFRIFRHDQDDPGSLPDNHVTALILDRDEQLWVGTNAGGLGRYDADKERFVNFPIGPGRDDALAAQRVHALAVAADGLLWVASGRGHLQRLGVRSGRFESIPFRGDVQAQALLALASGDVLIGSSEGLWRWYAKSGALELWSVDSAMSTSNVQVLALDGNGAIWVGTATQGIYQLGSDGARLRHLDQLSGLAGDDVRALLVDRAERVWVGTYTGLSRIDSPAAEPRTWTHDDSRRDGLSSDRVHALIEGRDGLIWIGTWLGGVNIYSRGSEAFEEYRSIPGQPRSLPGNAVRYVLADPSGDLWLGVQEGGGLVRFDPARGVLARFTPQPDDDASLASDRVQAIARDLDGNLWIGFVDAGLDRMSTGQTGFEHLPADPADPGKPHGINVLALYVDRGGTLWSGYQDAGLDALCRGCSEFRHYAYVADDPSSLPGESIAAIFESSQGELWVGALPGGLSRMDRSSGQFTPVASLLDNAPDMAPRSITTITESRSGDLWVGSQGAGILRMTRRPDGTFRATTYTHADGLAADAIGSIMEDAKGAMWVSTTQGVSRIEPHSGKIENFRANSGAQMNGYFIDAGARLADGRIVYGGLAGVTVLDPSKVVLRGALHRPAITSIRVFASNAGGIESAWQYRRASGDAADQLWLRAGSGGFGFSFSALSYADPDLVQYSYRLEPIDSEWIEAVASQRHAGYPHLGAGKYVLRLRTKYPGEDFGPERRVDVRLDALWWQSAWARGGVAIVLIALLGLWAWSRHQRAFERHRARLALSESEERLTLALWGTGDEFWDVDLSTGRIVRINPLQHLQVSQGSVSTLRGYAPFVHPQDSHVFDEAFSVHAKGASDTLDIVYRTRDTDNQWRWLRSRGRPVEHNEDGSARRMAGTTQDITELREYESALKRINQQLEERVAERTVDLTRLNNELVETIETLKLTQHQLVESEKLAALGGLVAGIAHEVNTPLGVGVTAASYLEQQAQVFTRHLDEGTASEPEVLAFRDTVLECSNMVLRNLQRADRMIRSFKQVAVDQASEQPRQINLFSYLEEIHFSLQPTLKRHRHSLTIDAPPDLALTTQPGAIYQVVVNLVMNSLTHAFAGRQRGEMCIRVTRQPDAIVVDYRDNGCGISDEVRRHIFEPFFTTRRGQGGSGLGMHIVYNQATQVLGGSIECLPDSKQGAHFILRIPVGDATITTMPD